MHNTIMLQCRTKFCYQVKLGDIVYISPKTGFAIKTKYKGAISVGVCTSVWANEISINHKGFI